LQFSGEALAYLVEVVAGNSVELRDDISVLSLDRACDKRRVVLRTDGWLHPAKRLFHCRLLPFALREIVISAGRLRLLPEVGLEFRVTFRRLEPVHDAPVDEPRQIRPEAPLRAVVFKRRQVAREIGKHNLHDVISVRLVQPLVPRYRKDKTGIEVEEPLPRRLVLGVRDRF